MQELAYDSGLRIQDLELLAECILSKGRDRCQATAGAIYLPEGAVFVQICAQDETFTPQEQRLTRHTRIGRGEGRGLLSPPIFSLSLTGPKGNVEAVLDLSVPPGSTWASPAAAQDERLRDWATQAAVAVGHAQTTYSLVHRLVRMLALCDPGETVAHAHRVGNYAVEIFREWASQQGLPDQEVVNTVDTLRYAAMLHDVGKASIPGDVLVKPEALTDQQFDVMKTHTVAGARLFEPPDTGLDAAIAEVALNHHQKWDGTGYPGPTHGPGGEGKRGTAIPVSAQVVGLADVYDVLGSDRSYRRAWSENSIRELIRSETDKHFSPEIVKAFFSIQDVLRAIRKHYPDAPRETPVPDSDKEHA